jgi:fibronectin-binding autotransporter adhesin
MAVLLSGAVTSALSLIAGAVLDLSGDGLRTLNDLMLNTFNATIGGATLVVQSGTLNDTGTLTVGTGAALNFNGGAFTTNGLDVDGTFRLNAPGVHSFGQLNNTSTVVIAAGGGELNLSQNGTHGSTFNVGSGSTLRFSNNSTHTFTSACTIDGAGTTVVEGAGTTWTGGSSTTVGTALEWNGGVMTGAGTTNVQAGMSSGGAVTLDRAMMHAGTSVWSNAANVNGTGSFTNVGSFTAANGQNFAPSFVNNGTLIKTGLSPSVYSAAGGLVNNGTLRGTGTLTTDVINNGTISPGNSPGTLTVNG